MATKFLKDSSGRLYTDAITKKPIAVDMSFPALSNPATAEDIASGKEAYGADGAVITGTATGGNPFTATTDTEMTELLNGNNIGKIVQFIGTTTDTYENGAYYVIEVSE